jgi:hypothetical protein
MGLLHLDPGSGWMASAVLPMTLHLLLAAANQHRKLLVWSRNIVGTQVGWPS